MSVSHRYQSFSSGLPRSKVGDERTEEEVEDEKLTSFEKGYQAGWDDATETQEDTKNKLSADFLQHLEDLSFTYHEAYAKLSEGLEPLFSQMIDKLLPEIARKSLGIQIIDQLTRMIETEGHSGIEIALAPERRAYVEQLLADRPSIPFTIAAETALTGGQVYLRSGQTEREINLDAVVEGIRNAFDAFFHTTTQEENNG